MTGLHTRRRGAGASCVALAALAAVLWTAGSLTACGLEFRDDANGVSIRQPEGPTVSIGVASDQPGLGVWHNGGYSGFDVDVARYVAKALGYADKQIVFKPVTPPVPASPCWKARRSTWWCPASASPNGMSRR